MAKAVDYINETIVGDFERGYYVSKGDAVQAVEIERTEMVDKACKIYCDNLCERSRCGMCYYKYDRKAQVKNDFKYSECETLKMFRKDMEG